MPILYLEHVTDDRVRGHRSHKVSLRLLQPATYKNVLFFILPHILLFLPHIRFFCILPHIYTYKILTFTLVCASCSLPFTAIAKGSSVEGASRDTYFTTYKIFCHIKNAERGSWHPSAIAKLAIVECL
jgi:hypothetical protein